MEGYSVERLEVGSWRLEVGGWRFKGWRGLKLADYDSRHFTKRIEIL